jgi:hypothetical protein
VVGDCTPRGVSDGAPSSAAVSKDSDGTSVFICIAVACIALNKRVMFCCLFRLSDPEGAFRLPRESGISSLPSTDMVSSSDVRFFLPSSDAEGSKIGHIKPVRGVYSGR